MSLAVTGFYITVKQEIPAFLRTDTIEPPVESSPNSYAKQSSPHCFIQKYSVS